jgi:predicted permease
MRLLLALIERLTPPPDREWVGGDTREEFHRIRQSSDAGAARWWLVREFLRVLGAAPRHRLAVRARAPHAFHHQRGDGTMSAITQDLRVGLRLLARSPGFAAAAVLTLALGIGANAAMFTLAKAVLLTPIDVRDPERLMTVAWSSAYPDYLEYAKRTDAFDGVIATSGGGRLNVSFDESSELVSAGFVSGNAFDVLGVTAAAGRALLPSDDVMNGAVVATIGYDYWQTRFGGDPGVVGKQIRVNGRPVTIVGVMRQGFRGLSLGANASLFLPITSTIQVRTGFLGRPDVLVGRNFAWVAVTLRLAEGVTPAQASDVIATTYRQHHPTPPGAAADRLDPVVPLRTRALGQSFADIRQFVWLLVGVVALTLLIGCANLANLLLARSAARRREVSIRLAIGGSRMHVVRQMLVETLVLSTFGGIAALLVASWALRLLMTFQLPGGTGIDLLHLSIDRWTLAGTAALSLITGLLFGVAPALRVSRTDAALTLRDEGRGMTARSGLRSALVGAQVAMSLVLLAGGGLFLRSLVHALATPLGFDVQRVATASVNAGLARFDETRTAHFYEQALARVQALPDVRAAAWTSLIPTNGEMSSRIDIQGYEPASNEDMSVLITMVGPQYFSAVGTRILAGRGFEPDDSRDEESVAIVSRAAAERFWKGSNALGGFVRGGDRQPWRRIIGIAEDITGRSLTDSPTPLVYYPFNPFANRNDIFVGAAHLIVRTTGDERALAGVLPDLLRSVDRDMPVYDVLPFAQHVRELVMPQRMGVTLFGLFSVLALSLATVGIYGVASYVTALRTRELGIRLALGADARHIRRLVIAQGMLPAMAGVLIGTGLALWAGGLARAFLYDVSPSDPATLGVVAATLVAVTALATWIPARRAARLDPVATLRHE